MGDEKDYYIYEYVGFSGEIGREVVIILSTLSLFVNIIFIINYLTKIIRNKLSEISILEKILLLLSIIEWFISLVWILSAFFYPTNREIREHVEKGFINGCKFISYFSIYLYIIDWLFLGYSIFLIKQIILNPIEIQKEKSSKNFFKDIIYYFIIAGIALFFTHFFHYRGESPMITCSLSIISKKKKHVVDTLSYIIIFLLILIPSVNLIYCIIQIIIICKDPIYKTDKDKQKFFIKYIIYIGSYIFFTLLLFSLYVISYFLNIDKNWKYEEVREINFVQWYFCIVTMISCSSPFIIGIIRFFQTGLYHRIRQSIKNNNFSIDILLPMLNKTKNEDEDEDEEHKTEMMNFENKSLLKFVTNIYISISFCLEYDEDQKVIDENEINEELCKESNKHKINKNKIKNCIRLSSDDIVNSKDNFHIEVVEYAPKIFKFLRNLEGEDIKKMIKAFLPSNNKSGIKESEGRSGNLFINTYDKQYMLKTINSKEMDLLKSKLLFQMCQYLKNNKDSLISRLYGLFKIKMSSGILKEEELYIILMKNVFGTFDKENIIVKYDLKGSTLNRKVEKIKGQKVQPNVLKDINFAEDEKVIKVSKKYSEKLSRIINKDAEFLYQQQIMDYSLLVIKVSVDDLQSKIIFGEKIVEYHKRLYEKIKKKVNRELKNNKEIEVNKNEIGKKIIENLFEENDNDSNNISIDSKLDYSSNAIKRNYSEIDITFEPSNLPTIQKYCWPSIKQDFFYVIAIIDFFQLYDFNKKMETVLKGMKHKKEDISSMDSQGYKNRFIEAMNKITDYNNIIKNIVDEEITKYEEENN